MDEERGTSARRTLASIVVLISLLIDAPLPLTCVVRVRHADRFSDGLPKKSAAFEVIRRAQFNI